MKEKLNLIFKPYIFTLIGLTAACTLINWVFFIELKLFPVKEIVANFVIPIVLTTIAAWFVLRSKLKILNLAAKRGNWRDFYSFITWAILTVPIIIAQEYIVTATGKLTELNSINEMNSSVPTKYYTLKTYFIDKSAVAVHREFEVTGKHSQNFDMKIYAAMPIFETLNDTSKIEPLAWLGVKYNKTISNRLDSKEKDAIYLEFAKESQMDFENRNVSEFVYLDRIGNSNIRDGYSNAIKNSSVYKHNETILVGVNEPYEARNGKKLQWLFGSILIGTLIWIVMLLIPKIDQAHLERINSGKPDKAAQKEIKEFFDFIKPREGFYITPLLIYINIGIFVLMVIIGFGFIRFNGQDLVKWGANYGPLTKAGEWWRLLSNTFLHGGVMHIFTNMYALLFVGVFLEPLLGRRKYLTAYLLSGILASAASIYWHDATVSVGASGAIFGLYGLFLALLLTKVYPPDFAKSFLISTAIFVGFNLLMGFTGGIDNAVHIGGLITGFVIGLFYYPQLKQNIN